VLKSYFASIIQKREGSGSGFGSVHPKTCGSCGSGSPTLGGGVQCSSLQVQAGVTLIAKLAEGVTFIFFKSDSVIVIKANPFFITIHREKMPGYDCTLLISA
jgi:hypothetical protein